MSLVPHFFAFEFVGGLLGFRVRLARLRTPAPEAIAPSTLSNVPLSGL